MPASLLSLSSRTPNGIAKILLWFGSVGTGVAASAIVAREVEKQFDETVKAVKEARDHVEIED